MNTRINLEGGFWEFKEYLLRIWIFICIKYLWSSVPENFPFWLFSSFGKKAILHFWMLLKIYWNITSLSTSSDEFSSDLSLELCNASPCPFRALDRLEQQHFGQHFAKQARFFLNFVHLKFWIYSTSIIGNDGDKLLMTVTMITMEVMIMIMMTMTMMTVKGRGDPVVESGQITSLSLHRKGSHRKSLISAK